MVDFLVHWIVATVIVVLMHDYLHVGWVLAVLSACVVLLLARVWEESRAGT